MPARARPSVSLDECAAHRLAVDRPLGSPAIRTPNNGMVSTSPTRNGFAFGSYRGIMN